MMICGYAHRLVNEALTRMHSPGKGPVHINVPLAEPLYEEFRHLPQLSVLFRQAIPEISVTLPDELLTGMEKRQKGS